MTYAQLLLPDFSLILCGWLVCRYTALKRPVWEQVEVLVYYFLFPVLLFHSIVKSPLDLQGAARLIAAGLCMTLTGALLSWLLPHLPGLRHRIDARQHAAGAQVSFRFNSYIALALADRLAGAQGLLLVAILLGFCVPVVNVAAVWPMARHAGRGVGRELMRNPLIIATALGLIANVLGFKVPVWLEPTFTRIGAASLALGLMATGAGLRLASLAQSRSLTVGVLTIRHFILPLVAWVLAHWLGLDTVQTTMLLAFSALPTASSAYVLAVRMGYDGAYVAALITLSTLLGIASLTFALGVLN